MELKYTSKIIGQIEDEYGKLQDILQEFSMANLVLFVSRGLGVDKDKAYEAIDEYIKEKDKDTMELYLHINEKLQEGGFLSRKADFKKIRAKIDDKIEKELEEELEKPKGE